MRKNIIMAGWKPTFVSQKEGYCSVQTDPRINMHTSKNNFFEENIVNGQISLTEMGKHFDHWQIPHDKDMLSIALSTFVCDFRLTCFFIMHV